MPNMSCHISLAAITCKNIFAYIAGWRLAPGAWRLALGAWRLTLGAWRLALGASRVAPGAWHMALAWRLVIGGWRFNGDQKNKKPSNMVTIVEALGLTPGELQDMENKRNVHMEEYLHLP